MRKIRNRRRARELAAHPPQVLKLDLGGTGAGRDGYFTVNLDLDAWTDYWADITDLDAIGIKDSSVDEIFLSHTFEHIELQKLAGAIDNWHRKLKQGGVLRIKGPNVEEFCALYKQGTISDEAFIHLLFSHYPRVVAKPLMAHRWAWTRDFLKHTLKEHGFKNIEEYDAGGWHCDLEWFPEYKNMYFTDLGIVATK